MSVKLTGAELNAFMADKSFWTDGRWYDDAAVSINGCEFFDWDAEAIAPDDKIVWQGGVVYDHGDVGAPFCDLERELKRWLKARTVTTVVLEIEKWDFDATMERILKNASVKVLK